MMRVNFPRRLMVSAVVAVTLVATLGEYFFAKASYWPFISAFLMIQLERNTGVRQKLILLFLLVMTVWLAALVRYFFTDPVMLILLVSSIYLIISLYLFCLWPTAFALQMLLIFFLLLMMNMLTPFKFYPIEHQIIGILFGAGLGMLANYIVNPLQYGRDFKAGVTPIFVALENYLIYLKKSWLMPAPLGQQVESATEQETEVLQIDHLLQDYKASYPEWVYAAGFNPGLRAGLRYYLIKLDQLIEVFFSVDLYFSKLNNQHCMIVDAKLFLNVIEQNLILLDAMVTYFKSEKYNAIPENMTEDIQLLDDELSKMIPNNMELVDMNPCHMFLLNMARDLRDMRSLLLQLMMCVI